MLPSLRKLLGCSVATALIFAAAILATAAPVLDDPGTLQALAVCAAACMLGLLIIDTPVWFGFGPPGLRRAASWPIGLSVSGVATAVFVGVAGTAL